MSKSCCTCIHWEKVIPQISGDTFGICDNASVAMKVALDGKTHLGEGGTFWTQEYFGCVYHGTNDGGLLSTDDEVKDELDL
ncbi:MAG: hypothetical protein JWO92_1101 [Chitinophagaceae bacterium]|nr:hypothetical protein [Chitinophagaceae bacterium]